MSHLRLWEPALLQPEVLVGKAADKFDAEGKLVDLATSGFPVE